MTASSSTSSVVRPLTAVLAEKGPVPAQEALAILRQLLGVVHRLHVSGKIHRGIGPQTILLNEAGKVGLAPPPALQEMGNMRGSLEITPPELQLAEALAVPVDIEAARALLAQARIEIDPRRIDLYQIGAILCRLLTGDSVSAYLHSPLAKVKVPAAVQPVLERALGYQVTDRFADCDEFLTALNRVVLDQAPRASAETPSQGSPTVAEAIKAQVGCAPTVRTPKAPERDAQEKDLPFAQLGHYRIIKRLGRGGMGDVYLGYEDALKRHVAIKVLPDELARNEDFVTRFHAEASAAAKVAHPNIVLIYLIGKEGPNHFFAMQYVEGESLDRLLARSGRLGIDETVTVLEQCLAGLGAAHQEGLIHRDIKPGNVLIENKTGRALIADFGLVKSASAGRNMTATGMIVGTVDYIAPEQACGQKVDARADLYALGVLAYQLLSGRLPFQAETATAMLFKHVYEKPPPLRETAPEVPAALAAVVGKLLAKDPNDRYQNCAEVLAALRDRQPAAPVAAPAAKIDKPCPVPAARVPRFVSSAELEKVANVPVFFEESVATGWWPRWRARVRSLFQAHAPEFAQQLQTTGQQVDGALAEYQKRRDQLARLVQEAQKAHEELASQARAFRAEAGAVGRLAESASEGSAVRRALQEQEKWAQSAAELEQQAAEQEEQLSLIRAEYAKADATLGRLKSQRDALNARLRAAEAQVRATGDRPASRRPWLKAAALLPWWLWLAGAGGLLAVMLCVVLVPSKKEPAVPKEEMQVAHRDPVTPAKTPVNDKTQPVPEPVGPPSHVKTPAPDKPKSVPQAPAESKTVPIEPAGKVEPPAKGLAPPALLSPAPGAVVENGTSDLVKLWTWEFKWSKVEGASKYHLMVVGPHGLNPLVNEPNLTAPSYRKASKGYIRNEARLGWRWKVRAQINGTWSDWSEERTFDVQPLGTQAKILPGPVSGQKPEGKEKPLVKQIENSIGMKLNQIPAGTFLMGTPTGIWGESPQHEVTISRPFYMGVYEVTQQEYKVVLGDIPSSYRFYRKSDDPEHYPVDNVLWSEAVEFCKKLSEWPGEKKVGRRYRLPTEAEWEYACRAGSKDGDYTGPRTPRDRTNYGDRNNNTRTKIGDYDPNDFGLFDMHGNVSEWCSDWCDRDYYKYSPTVDPQGPVTGPFRVSRGGNDHLEEYWRRSASRAPNSSLTRRPYYVGFRVVCTLDAEQKPAATPSDVAMTKTDTRPYPVSNSLGMRFIRIPSGKFLMGSLDGAAKDEVPRHEVEIGRPFYLGIHEVAQFQYEKVMGWDPSQFAGDAKDRELHINPPLPVENVSWYDAATFCEALSRMPDEKAAGRSYRLPTEAEWEYACRAGTDRQFHYGDSLSSGQANFDGNHPYGDAGKGPFLQKTNKIGIPQITAFSWYDMVGSYRPNAFGLYDMHGNVSEWCADFYDRDYYKNSPRQDPLGPKSGERRVLRGGSWKTSAEACRSACRQSSLRENRDSGTGLRVVCMLASDPQLTETPAARAPATNQPTIANSIGMKLAPIPAGKFIMGATRNMTGVNMSDPNYRPHEAPLHEVVLTRPFHMGIHEVTQAEYKKVTGKNPETRNRMPNPDHPVHPVSWGEAVEFCKKLSELPEEKKAGRVYRLPTEAEWEYACRAGTTTAYSFGDAIAFKQANFDYPRHWGNREEKVVGWSSKVGSYPANAFGLHDMHGNVMEYCLDWYDPNYYRSSPRLDPRGPSTGVHHVVRGGDWNQSDVYCRSSYRMDFYPLPGGLVDLSAVGFRVVCTIEAKPKP